VRDLLARLAAVKEAGALAGQSVAEPAAGYAEVQSVLAATGKLPAIIEVDLTGAIDSKTLLARVREATGRGELVLLRWSPPRPTDGAVAGTLTDFEWRELLETGTDLNQRWMAQADAAAALLDPLAEAHLAVLWSPYPASNGTGNWWAGRPGPDGSRELYLRLHERLTAHDNLHNLAWVWEAAPPSFNPAANNSLEDFFPGPLSIDALMLDADTLGGRRFPLDRILAPFAGGKPFGVRVASGVPGADALERPSGWRWMILTSAAAGSDDIKGFYSSERVVSAPQK
jgi:mannan endo-1,4-beta-mannosidase